MDGLVLVWDYKWPCQLTGACAARNTGKLLAEAPGVTEIQLLLIRRRENISICLDWGKRICDSSASICWCVDNTYGHTDICEVTSNRNQINHRSQHVICLIMSNTSHFLSVQKALCERADGAARGWHQPRQLQMQSVYTARWKSDTTQAASWEKNSNWTSVTKQNTCIYWCSELIWSSPSLPIKYIRAGQGVMLSRQLWSLSELPRELPSTEQWRCRPTWV